MGGFSAAIELDAVIDSREVTAALQRLSGTVQERSMFDDIGGALHALTMDRFESSTAPDGSSWEPSARALLEDGKTLVDHAHLRDSFTWEHTPGGGIEFGSDMIYAAIHQSGGKTGRGHAIELPAREMVPGGDWPSDYLLEISDIVIDHITRSIQ